MGAGKEINTLKQKMTHTPSFSILETDLKSERLLCSFGILKYDWGLSAKAFTIDHILEIDDKLTHQVNSILKRLTFILCFISIS